MTETALPAGLCLPFRRVTASRKATGDVVWSPRATEGPGGPQPCPALGGSLQSRSWETRPWGPLVLTLWVQIAKENPSLLSHRENGGHQRRKGSPRQLCSSARPLMPTCPWAVANGQGSGQAEGGVCARPSALPAASTF